MDPQKQVIKCKIGFIGGGNMARAIAEGIVRRGKTTLIFFYLQG